MKKALSIKQPWASLIAHNIKNIENRTWKTHFRGKIYIHASAVKAKDFDFSREQTDFLADINTNDIEFPVSASKYFQRRWM